MTTQAAAFQAWIGYVAEQPTPARRGDAAWAMRQILAMAPDGSLMGAALVEAQRVCDELAREPAPAPVVLPKALPDDIVIHGDCLTALRTMPDSSVDAVVTDPPAGIGFMGKAWDSHAAEGKTELQAFQDFIAEVFTEVYRVLKPGGHAVVWALPRTSHHTAMGLERAGFDIRDTGTYLFHLFGTGFPKSARVNLDPRFCQCAEAVRSGVSRGPAPARASRKDTEPVLDGGVLPCVDARRSSRTDPSSQGGCPQDSDSCDGQLLRVSETAPTSVPSRECAQGRNRSGVPSDALVVEQGHTPFPVPHTAHRANRDSPPLVGGLVASGGTLDRRTLPDGRSDTFSRTQRTSGDSASLDCPGGFTVCQVCGKPDATGFGTALKPAVEFWILARKPFDSTVAANVLAHGTGALNIDACRITHASAADLAASQARNPGRDDVVTSTTYGANRPQQQVNVEGRFPANLLLDEGAAALLDEQSVEKKGSGKLKVSAGTKQAPAGTLIKGMGTEGRTNIGVRDFGDSGGASRFFYTAKAPGSEKYAALTCGCTAQLAVDAVPVLALDEARKHKGRACPTCKQEIDLAAHPTVKSTALMEWLIKLVTPPGGLVLDPFTGSGSTGVAALRNGFAFRGIERETAYCAIARQRITDAKPAAKRDPRKRHVRP